MFVGGMLLMLASMPILTFFDRRSENIGIVPIIVAELKLGNIEVKVLFADLVEVSHDAAFDQRPEAFDGLSVDAPTTYCSLA
jgi:hypothetical protein